MKDELRRWCNRFHVLGLAPVYEGRSLGNLSFRLGNRANTFVITASALALKENLPDDAFVTVYGVSDKDEHKILAAGGKPPSSESLLHFRVYERRQEIMAIFHGHSRDILKAAELLKLPVTRTAEPHGSAALAESVVDILGEYDFIILRKHGFLSLGRSMNEAGERAVEMLNRSRETLKREPREP